MGKFLSLLSLLRHFFVLFYYVNPRSCHQLAGTPRLVASGGGGHWFRATRARTGKVPGLLSWGFS